MRQSSHLGVFWRDKRKPTPLPMLNALQNDESQFWNLFLTKIVMQGHKMTQSWHPFRVLLLHSSTAFWFFIQMWLVFCITPYSMFNDCPQSSNFCWEKGNQRASFLLSKWKMSARQELIFQWKQQGSAKEWDWHLFSSSGDSFLIFQSQSSFHVVFHWFLKENSVGSGDKKQHKTSANRIIYLRNRGSWRRTVTKISVNIFLEVPIRWDVCNRRR